jgi:hypothetical protein
MTDTTITRLASIGFAPSAPIAVPQRSRMRAPRAAPEATPEVEPVAPTAPVTREVGEARLHPARARTAMHAQPDAPAPTSAPMPKPEARFSLRKRLAVLVAAIAVPAMAAPAHFPAEPGAAPTEAAAFAALTKTPSMPFERAGQSFPGSAFYYVDDSSEEALVALPTADPLDFGGEDGRELGSLIDAGPAANGFFVAGSAISKARAQRCLSEAIWYEAGTESEAGQRAVAQVVLNRVAHPNYPGSVCGVVYEGSQRSTGCQFSFTCDGSLARTPVGPSWSRAQKIAAEALAGKTYAPIGLATHYHTRFVNPYWASSLDHIGTIGAHRFYLMRGDAGKKGAFTGTYSGIEPSVSGRIPQARPSRSAATPDFSTPDFSAKPSPRPARRSPVSDAVPRAVPSPSGAVSAPVVAAPSAPPSSAPAVPRSGQVKEQYSNAGAWKKRPGDTGNSGGAAPAPGTDK